MLNIMLEDCGIEKLKTILWLVLTFHSVALAVVQLSYELKFKLEGSYIQKGLLLISLFGIANRVNIKGAS